MRRGIFPRLIVISAVLAAGCGAAQPELPPLAPVDMQLLAVLPVEPATADVPEGAGMAVTAQIYRVLTEQTEFRFVPDLTVSDVIATPEVRRAGGLVERALALGREVGADGIIFGRVSRFEKRLGSAYDATKPASVAFDLGLVAVARAEVIWKGSFDETQQEGVATLLDWLMFWGPGPRWMSAAELTGGGVDRLFEQLTTAVNTTD